MRNAVKEKIKERNSVRKIDVIVAFIISLDHIHTRTPNILYSFLQILNGSRLLYSYMYRIVEICLHSKETRK